jgi:hypothetical protein
LGDCFLGAILRKIAEVVHIFELLQFYEVKNYALILTKNGSGYILGDFFKKSSGHPAYQSKFSEYKKLVASSSFTEAFAFGGHGYFVKLIFKYLVRQQED